MINAETTLANDITILQKVFKILEEASNNILSDSLFDAKMLHTIEALVKRTRPAYYVPSLVQNRPRAQVLKNGFRVIIRLHVDLYGKAAYKLYSLTSTPFYTNGITQTMVLPGEFLVLDPYNQRYAYLNNLATCKVQQHNYLCGPLRHVQTQPRCAARMVIQETTKTATVPEDFADCIFNESNQPGERFIKIIFFQKLIK